MLRTLYRLAAVWTVVGLASGLFYREFTKAFDVAGGTQLAVVHTHTLLLGTIFTLLVLAMVKVLALDADRRFRWFVLVWNIGLAVTTGGMLVKGMLQVMGHEAATHPAIAGVSGLGHMTLTAAFVLFFLVLGRRVKALESGTSTADSADAAPVVR
ncbi:MAG: DUF2871 domain-containing protein [Propionibacteriaceae bacterium]